VEEWRRLFGTFRNSASRRCTGWWEDRRCGIGGGWMPRTTRSGVGIEFMSGSCRYGSVLWANSLAIRLMLGVQTDIYTGTVHPMLNTVRVT
jgi:hypothetical protein